MILLAYMPERARVWEGTLFQVPTEADVHSGLLGLTAGTRVSGRLHGPLLVCTDWLRNQALGKLCKKAPS